ncbi:MAG: ATP-binding protein [Endomicrobia bacterium]|nr:ATP-binding protein [Endomicrobiia bacterium]
MTIRNKLTSLFFVLLGLIFILVICLITTLYLQRQYFLYYVDIQKSLTLLESIIQNVSFQRLYFDYYILFNDEKDKENFTAISDRIKNLYDEYKKSNEGKNLFLKYQAMTEVANRVFDESKRERKVSIAMTEFLPKYEIVLTELENQRQKHNEEKMKLERTVTLLTIVSWVISIAVILVACFIIVTFGVRIYRSLTRSLRVIIDFAHTLSRGEYRNIFYSTDDEFAEVISVFNYMVQNLKTLQAQIIQMDRLSNIGQLAGGIAHELNNPLVGVLGQAQILLEKLPADSPLREHVEKIERAARRCKENVGKLLQFSRQKEYEYTEVDMNELIKNVLFIADSELKEHDIQVITMFSNDLPMLSLSIPHMQQALLNIVNNAIQAMSENTNKRILYIKTYTVTSEENNKLSKYIAVEFQDTGCGIEKQNLTSVFEPFFTTKDRNKFAGMGLAITKDIILHHKGKISVFSEGINKGAKFTIYLPCHEDK